MENIPQRPIVVSLCDETGNMVRPWANGGFTCYCVDTAHGIRNDRVEPADNGGQIIYTWGDCRSWLPPDNARIAILFGFPPCTHVANSGARDFKRKGSYMLRDALETFASCLMAGAYSGAPYMIENPRGKFNDHMGQPDYRFDPCAYGGYLDPPGDAYTKETCLWTGNGFIMPPPKPVEPTEGSKMHRMPPSPEREKLRSATPMGFAQAVYEANNVRIQDV